MKKTLLKACGVLEIIFGIIYLLATISVFALKDNIVEILNQTMPNSVTTENFAYISTAIVALLIIDVLMYILNLRASKAIKSGKKADGTIIVEIVLSILSGDMLLLILYIIACVSKEKQATVAHVDDHSDEVPALGKMSVDDICLKCKVSKEDARLMAKPVTELKQMVEDNKLSKEKYVDILIKISNLNKGTR